MDLETRLKRDDEYHEKWGDIEKESNFSFLFSELCFSL
jgi:hypothetical protein